MRDPRTARARLFRCLRRHGAALVVLTGLWAAPLPAEPASVDPNVAESEATAEERGASAAIDALHEHLLGVMRRATELGYAGREQALSEVIPRYFDVDFMAQKSLGRHWKHTEAEQRERYLETFSRFMVANYAGRFDGFSGQSFETLGEEAARVSTVIVKSRLRNPNREDVDLNYRMRRVDGEWKIIDVYLDGSVSELALRRSEFMSIMKREDLDGLLAALDAKIANFAEGAES